MYVFWNIKILDSFAVQSYSETVDLCQKWQPYLTLDLELTLVQRLHISIRTDHAAIMP